jgi:hypothetical protein
METEKANRISLFLSPAQEEFMHDTLLITFQEQGGDPNSVKNLKLSDLIVAVFIQHGMPERYVRPKNDRGQGRKKKQILSDLERAEAALLSSVKGNKNINTESEQDVFSWDENSLAPCVGVNSDAE